MTEKTLHILAENVKISDLLVTKYSATPVLIDYIAQGSEDNVLEIAFVSVHDKPIRIEFAYDEEITVVRITE